MTAEEELRKQAFLILSSLQSGTESVVCLSVALAAIAAERERLRALIADDAYVSSFQTLGQYRSALLRAAGL